MLRGLVDSFLRIGRSFDQQDFFGSSWPTKIPPVIEQPPSGASGISVILGLNLALAGVALEGGVDDVTQTRWEVRTGPNGTGALVWSADNITLLTILLGVVPALTMALGQTYYIRARQTFATLGVGPWSLDTVINT